MTLNLAVNIKFINKKFNNTALYKYDDVRRKGTEGRRSLVETEPAVGQSGYRSRNLTYDASPRGAKPGDIRAKNATELK